MRTRTRILAFLLTLLMLVGMYPLSVIAADETENIAYGEQIRRYAAENGGELLFASDFETATVSGDKIKGQIVDSSLTLNPKESTIEVSDGVLKTTSSSVMTGNDPYITASPKVDEGESLVVEMEFVIYEQVSSGNAPFLQYIDRNVHGSSVSVFANMISIDGENNLKDADGKNMVKLEFGKTVKIQLVMVPRLNAAYYYIDGVFVSAENMLDSFANTYGNAASVRHSPKLSELRLLQIPNTGIGSWGIDSLYIYKNVNTPYNVTSVAPGSETYTEFAEFLKENDAVMFGGTDFEYTDAALSKTVNGTVNTTVGETDTVYDAYYDLVNGVFTSSTAGTTWLYTDYTGLSENLTIKLTTAQFLKEGDNTYYRLNTGWPRSLDSLLDTNFGQYFTPGEDIVVSADIRADADRRNSYNLFGIIHRSPYGGADRSGVSRVHQYLLKLNNKNEIYTEIGNVYIGRIVANDFTNIACIIHPTSNTFDVYINGICIAAELTFLNEANLKIYREGYTIDGTVYAGAGDDWPDYFKPGSMRTINNNGINVNDGAIEIDNIRAYNSDKIYGEKNAPLTGWQNTEEGYWRYYDENGIPAIGNVEIDGKTYFFNQDGYVTKAERVSYIDLAKYFESKGTGGDNIANTSSALGLAANKDITGSFKYTALWTNMFKEGLPGTQGGNDTDDNRDGGATEVNIRISLAGINSSILKNNYNMPLQDKDRLSTVLDLTEYDAVEINWYTNKPSDFALMIMLDSLNGNSNAYGYVEGISPYNGDFVGGAYFGYTLKLTEESGVQGWNSTVLDLTGGANPVPGAGSISVSRLPRLETITGIKFSTVWSNVNADNIVASGFEWYLDSINLVRYVPVTEDPRELGVVRTENGSTYIYNDSVSDYSTGWQTVGEDLYYCNTYNGKAVTGKQIIDGISYVFDDTGKCIEENATGVYVIGNYKYVYIDGELQVGEFEYDGVKYYTASDGAVNSEVGKVGYTFDAAYTAPDYSKLSSYLILEDFNQRSGYIGNTQKNENFSLSGGTQYKNGYNITNVVKMTRFHYVDDGSGNIVLKVYNKANYTDPYININLRTQISSDKTEVRYDDGTGNYVKSDIVVEITAKLGDDWHGTGTLLQAIDRRDAKRDANLFLINEQGYVYNSAGIICKLSTEEFTRLSAAYDIDEKIFTLYVNGVEITTFTPSSAYVAPTEFRTMQYNSGGHGTMYLDNYALYLASEPIEVKTGVTLRDGLVDEGGFYRYYDNGVIKTGSISIDGTDMIFDPLTGYSFTGFDNDYYYKDGVRCDYVGFTTIAGLDYFFNADNKVVKNTTITIGMKLYDADGNGILSNERYVTDSKELLGAFEIANSTQNGELEAQEGYLVYNFKGLNHGPKVYFDSPVDITDMDAIRLSMFIGGDSAMDADLGIILGKDVFYFPVEATVGSNGNITVTAVLDGKYSSMDDIPNKGTVTDTGKYVTYNGLTYRVSTNTYTSGGSEVTEYYLRDWSYDMMTIDLANYGTGWVTIDLPISKFGHTGALDRTTVEYLQFAVSGWSLNGNGGFAPNAANLDVRIASVSAISYSGRDSSKNGIDGEFFYENGALISGWQSVNGKNYYFDPVTGMMVKGLVYLTEAPDADEGSESTGKYYFFDEEGVCQGEASGIYEIQIPVKNGDKYELQTEKKIFENGVITDGLVTVGDKTYYYNPNTGEFATNQTLIVGGKIYDFDENGEGTPHIGWYIAENGHRYYYDNYVGLGTDLLKIDGIYYYFHNQNHALIRSSWVVAYNMYFGDDGAAASGIVENVPYNGKNETMYFVNGVPTAAEILDEDTGILYEFGEDGVLIESVDMTKARITLTVIKDGNVIDTVNASLELGETFNYTLTAYPCYAIFDTDGNEITDLNYSLVISEYVVDIVITYKTYDEAGKAHRLDGGKQIVDVACGVNGVMLYTCKDCGETFEQIIPMLNDHEFGDVIVDTEPGCATDGVGHRECARCGYVEENIVIPATGNHNFSTDLRYDPEEVIYYNHHYYECLECGKKLDPVQHTFTDWAPIEGTDTHERHCTECGYQEISAHAYGTQYDDINHWEECEFCGNTVNSAPHETVYGYDPDNHWGECACGYNTATTAHNPVKIQDKVEPSCTEEGSTEGSKCADCGYVIEEVETIGKVAHEYSEEEYEFNETYHWHICANCSTEIDCAEHSPDMENVTDSETTCLVCGCAVTVA